MTRKRFETVWLIFALILAVAVKSSWYNGHLPNPYLTEAFVVVGGAFAIYQIWRFVRRRSNA